jgi:hypothetical protein
MFEMTELFLTINWASKSAITKKKRLGMLIDVAISGYRIVIQKEAENILKYKDLK